MASIPLTGASNPTYINNTGENVRVVINYATNLTQTTIAGVNNSAVNNPCTIGKSLAFAEYFVNTYSEGGSIGYGSNMGKIPPPPAGSKIAIAYPTEFMLAPNQSFSMTCNLYNILVIPENG
jgi:hypothetical protein